MLKLGQSNSRGFTIVELLIVIVVVAIMAAITAVAYNGVTQRSQTSSIITNVRQWEKIIESYIAKHGHAPAADWNCPGDAESLPAKDGFAENFCFKPTNFTAGNGTGSASRANPATMELLRQGGDFADLPFITFPEVGAYFNNSDEGNQIRVFRGIQYDSDAGNWIDNAATLTYWIREPSCPIGQRMSGWTSKPNPGYIEGSTSYPSNQKFIDEPNHSGCVVKLSVNRLGTPRGWCPPEGHTSYNNYTFLNYSNGKPGERNEYCYQGKAVKL